MVFAIFLVWFGFGFVKMTYLRLLLNSLSQLMYMLLDSQHVPVFQKVTKMMALASLFLVQLGLFGFWIGSNDLFEATIEFNSLWT